MAELREVIARDYGARALPEQPQVYKTKSKNAQEAHEAIRPTSALRTPQSVAAFLNDDQRKLYELIWKRTVACQMIRPRSTPVSVEFACGGDARFAPPAPPWSIRAFSPSTRKAATRKPPTTTTRRASCPR